MQQTVYVVTLLLAAMSLLVITHAFLPAYSERSMSELAEQRYRITMLKAFLDELDGTMARQQKRTCLINAGLSRSCDYSEMAKAGDMNRYLTSGASPGKRGRRDVGTRSLKDLLLSRNKRASLS